MPGMQGTIALFADLQLGAIMAKGGMRTAMTTICGRMAAGTIGLVMSVGCAVPAYAGGLGLGLPSLPIVSGLPGTLGSVENRTTGVLDQNIDVVRDAVGRPRQLRGLETEPGGIRIVRGQVLALSPSDQSLAIARARNFTIVRQDRLEALGLTVVVLRVPDGMNAGDGLADLRKADPAGAYDVDHIYDPSGADANAVAPAQPKTTAEKSPIRIGMIDAGIDTRHEAFESAAITTQGFVAGGTPVVTNHGTAIASLLVGSDSDVEGALPGAALYAADVYCGQATGGSADAIARALAWLASRNIAVANISLAGPPNAILKAAVAAFVERGHVLVAAVGNDGPAAPLEYPAGYPGVVGVTSVDENRNIQLEANRGADIAFAARGVDVSVAAPKDHHETVSGTSFAAPIVAARFALLLSRPDPNAVAHAWSALEKEAVHLGPPGRNDIFGYGYLAPPQSTAHATAAK